MPYLRITAFWALQTSRPSSSSAPPAEGDSAAQLLSNNFRSQITLLLNCCDDSFLDKNRGLWQVDRQRWARGFRGLLGLRIL